MSKHYSDFELTLENCHREPVHRPEAIEGTGHLLAFRDDDTGVLLAMSEGACDVFGSTPEILETEGLSALSSKWRAPVEALRASGRRVQVESGPTSKDGKNHSLICHRRNGVVFLERERADPVRVATDRKVGFLEALRDITDLRSLSDHGASFMRREFGFDRVMVYQFDADMHGFVLGEAKRDDLEPFLGLHYPSTDIPEPVRDLFLLTRSRAIPDVAMPNHRLLFSPHHSGHLDLSCCQLRATSAVHLEYLGNMGVRATMTVSIIVRGKLWGLFAMHHYSARNPQYTARMQAEVLASAFSQRLLEIELTDLESAERESRKTMHAFLDELRIEDQFQLRVLRAQAPLRELCPCDGAAIVTNASQPFCAGVTPSPSTLLSIRDWLVSSGAANIFVTEDIAPFQAKDGQRWGHKGGLLAVRVSEIADTFIIWFRDPESLKITWAGDPRAPQATAQVTPDGQTRVSPRQSFQRWEETVTERCPPWEPWVLRMASNIRESILKLELKHNAARVARANDEFMQLAYAASHDLQEPLRTQLNYLEILKEELDESGNDQFDRYIGGATRAVHRMRSLVGDMLEYSQLDRVSEWEPVDLDALLTDLARDYAAALERTGGTLSWESMPSVTGDFRHFRSILQNLIGNALKYVAEDTKPVVKVFIRRHDRTFDVCVSDNGIGIESENHERIFAMFTRLHNQAQYSGTGIGLAIAKRAADTIGGTLGVESKPDGGSLFWLRFSEAQLVS